MITDAWTGYSYMSLVSDEVRTTRNVQSGRSHGGGGSRGDGAPETRIEGPASTQEGQQSSSLQKRLFQVSKQSFLLLFFLNQTGSKCSVWSDDVRDTIINANDKERRHLILEFKVVGVSY